jgi:hypothetical protein
LTTDDNSDKQAWPQMRTTGKTYITTVKPKHGMQHQYPYCKGRPGAKRCFDHP